MWAAPAYEEIHYVQHGVFFGLPVCVSQLLPRVLEHLEDCFASLTGCKQMQYEISKLSDRGAGPESLFDALINHEP
jgi:hypothetical protein